jgi:ribulose-5-phosphate 4-epimerase/fuculose-1-phosphate aldolase
MIKSNLATAYHILSHLGMDDHTYTHLSARPDGADYFYIYPFGLLFEEATPDNLLKVHLDGQILEGSDATYNQTGYVIHSSIYKARPDINAIFHIHTHAGVAVSAMEAGLIPISQWALHFYGRMSYHAYDSLALDDTHNKTLIKDLGSNFAMMMQNHGTVTCGKTIHEALFYTYHLEKACQTQVMAMQTGQQLIIPTKEICKAAVVDLLNFEKDLGARDWAAWIRKLKR